MFTPTPFLTVEEAYNAFNRIVSGEDMVRYQDCIKLTAPDIRETLQLMTQKSN